MIAQHIDDFNIYFISRLAIYITITKDNTQHNKTVHYIYKVDIKIINVIY